MTTEIPDLLKKAQSGEAKWFIQFGGQGGSYFSELKRLYKNEVLNRFFDSAFDALIDFSKRPEVKAEEKWLYPYGMDIGSWVRGENPPPADDENLYRCTLSFPGNQIAQLAYLCLVNQLGFPLGEMIKYATHATGHSQGLQAACAFSLAKEGDDFYQLVYDLVHWFACAGFFLQRDYKLRPVENVDIINLIDDKLGQRPSAMAILGGIKRKIVEDKLNEHNINKLGIKPDSKPEEYQGILISLQNTDENLVLTGHAEDLSQFYLQNELWISKNNAIWNFLDVSAPFHRFDIVGPRMYQFYEDPVCQNFKYQTSELKIPVISFFDGTDLREKQSLSKTLADTMVLRPLYWEKAIYPILKPTLETGITHVLDFGPGKISSMLTKHFIAGSEIEVISAVGKAGLRQLTEST